MKVRNPVLPFNIHIPDGEARVFDDKLYVYGSLDKTKQHYCSAEYRVAYTADMTKWNVSDVSFDEKQVNWVGVSKTHSSLSNVKTFDDLPAHIKEKLPAESRNIPIEQIVKAIEQFSQAGLPSERLLYAPDCIERNGKYYLYFCLSDDSEGVAIADNPLGRFDNVKRLPVDGIDPAVFIDDDGQAYYYWGQFKGNVAKLTADMTAIQQDTIVEGVVTEEKHHFHEGSSMRKRNGIYYYVYADTSRGKPTSLGYATSNSPMGPFVYRGVIIDNALCDPKSWNIHGSIAEFNGQWYVFYHRSSQNSDKMRRLCIEPIYFDEQGLIREVKMTSQGAGEPFTVNEQIPAYTACEVYNGAYIDKCDDSEALYMTNGSTAVFRYVHCDKNASTIRFDCIGDATAQVIANGKLVGQGALPVVNVDIKQSDEPYELAIKLTCDKTVVIKEIQIN